MSASPREIQVDSDRLADYVRTAVEPLAQDVHRLHSGPFREIPIGEGLFGPIDEAEKFAQAHRDLHAAFDPTVKAIADDIDRLAMQLRKTIDRYAAEDEKIEAELRRVAQRLSTGETAYQSDTVFAQAASRVSGTPQPPPTVAPSPPAPGGPVGPTPGEFE